MSQTIIIFKIAKFLKPTNPDLALSIVISDGHCHGFSVCHAAMRHIGKKAWWHAALSEIYKWDLLPESLEKEVHLPQQEEKQKLKDVFSKALDFLIFHQVTKTPQTEDYFLTTQSQKSLLKAGGAFEIIGADKKIKKIEHDKSITGTFSKEKLDHLLTAETMDENMVFILNKNHLISISYDKPHWVVYNPNYQHGSDTTIEKKYDVKGCWLDEIISIQTTSIEIIASSLEEKKEISFPPEPLEPSTVDKENLSFVASSSPSAINEIVKKAIEEKDGEKLINLLTSKNTNGFLGLSTIVDNFSGLLPDILKVIIGSPESLLKLTQALSLQNERSWTFLHTLLHQTPASPDRTLTDRIWASVDQRLEKNPELKFSPLTTELKNEINSDANILYSQYVNKHKIHDWTFLQMLFVKNPENLSEVLLAIAETKDGVDLITEAMLLRHSFNWTGLHTMGCYAPNSLPTLLNILEKAHKDLIPTLKIKTLDGWSGLHIIARYAPNSLQRYIEIIAKTEAGIQAINEAFEDQTNQEVSGLEMIEQNVPKEVHAAILKYQRKPLLPPGTIIEGASASGITETIGFFSDKKISLDDALITKLRPINHT